MNCGDVDRALVESSGGRPLPIEVQGHVAGCVHCRELLVALNSASVPDGPSLADLRRIESSLTANLRPVRPLASTRYILAGFAGIIVSILVILFAVLRMEPFGLEAMSAVQSGVVFTALMTSVYLLADSVVRQMVPGTRQLVAPRMLPAGISLLLVAVVGVWFPFEPDEDFLDNSLVCLRIGVWIAICAAIPFWLVMRRGAPLSAATTGAGAGFLAGLVGTSVLQIHCPNLDVSHILASHVGAAALCSLAGLLIGYGVQAVNARRRTPGVAY